MVYGLVTHVREPAQAWMVGLGLALAAQRKWNEAVQHYEQALTLRTDDRGGLFEVVKEDKGSQIFFSTTKPGIVRGNHYHTRKQEKFCVVKGEAIIRLRRIGTDKIIEYKVSGDKPVVVEMPIFYTHNIENVGSGELCTLFWTNELFNPNDSDTFFEKV